MTQTLFASPAGRASLAAQCRAVRGHTLALAAPLSPEDMGLQSMPDASPAKWHLAHTTWFFETVVLLPHAPGHQPVDARWMRLFNSYYEALGPRHPRPQRGLLSRPSVDEVLAYRAAIDTALLRFIADADDDSVAAAAPLIELGLHHEQQHQELLLTDVQHAFSLNPLWPAVRPGPAPQRSPAGDAGWVQHPGGEVAIGHPGGHASGTGFAFDNETPRHAVLLQPHALARRLVTNAEVRDFIADGGYRRPALWLSEGWASVQAHAWQAPLYWQLDAAGQPGSVFGLHGLQAWEPDAPACHLSFFEAAAFAEWAGARLPTEFEWEAAATAAQPPDDMFGAVWQWTRSSYDPYPRFRPHAGAVAEYNGKFMVGQIVLRGSSLATPPGHARASYRNFFPPGARWQFSGLRLARDL
jgi:ergothioneine biosynthesis protein EgtB